MTEPPRPDDLVSEQLAYYRERAPEYDDWWLRRGRYDQGDEPTGRWEAEKRELLAALESFGPRGSVLELAAGTGNYTAQLARLADEVTAVDASPETLAIARTKLPEGGVPVRFVEADLFDWHPGRRYDVVFFSFWLSHVPPGRFEQFWQLVDDALAPHGRVFFIDNVRPHDVEHRVRTPGSDANLDQGVAVRELADGRRFRIVKRFWDPGELEAALAALGWQAEVRAVGTAFFHGSATRAR